MKPILFFLCLFLTMNADTPFNCCYYAFDLSVSSSKVKPKILKEKRPEDITPPEPVVDDISKTVPAGSGYLGFMKLYQRCIILGLEVVGRIKTQHTYDCEQTHLKIRDSNLMFGGGIRAGFLCNGKTISYGQILIISTRLKANSTEDSPFEKCNYKSSGIALAFKVGMIHAIKRGLFIDVYAIKSRKNFNPRPKNLKISSNLTTIGCSVIKRISRL